jgi:hypothetical protein
MIPFFTDLENQLPITAEQALPTALPTAALSVPYNDNTQGMYMYNSHPPPKKINT